MSGAEGSGLSSAEAARRLVTEGPNALPAPRRRSAARRLAEQVVHMFALMLWVAAGLAILAGLPQLGVAIVAVILLNAVLVEFAQYPK